MFTPFKFEIQGEPASKANSRRVIFHKGRVRSIKSAKALDYVAIFHQQCPRLSSPLEDELAVWIRIYYKSRRPDLDESLILDCMQGKIYLNDRQVKEKHLFWSLDRESPRSIIIIAPLGQSHTL